MHQDSIDAMMASREWKKITKHKLYRGHMVLKEQDNILGFRAIYVYFQQDLDLITIKDMGTQLLKHQVKEGCYLKAHQGYFNCLEIN